MPCIFCDIATKKAPHFLVWEDSKYMAFLSIFPNTLGVTVVIPKQHESSYAFALSPQSLTNLTLAAQKVAHLLDQKLPNVGRTALVYEGFGVDHAHAKLFPMHGTNQKDWQPLSSNIKHYSNLYEGYISTHDSYRAKDEDLAELAAYLRSENNHYCDNNQ